MDGHIHGCRAAKEHTVGGLIMFFANFSRGSTSTNAKQRISGRRAAFDGAKVKGETLNAKLAIVSAHDKSATRLFSRTFVSGDVV